MPTVVEAEGWEKNYLLPFLFRSCGDFRYNHPGQVNASRTIGPGRPRIGWTRWGYGFAHVALRDRANGGLASSAVSGAPPGCVCGGVEPVFGLTGRARSGMPGYLLPLARSGDVFHPGSVVVGR